MIASAALLHGVPDPGTSPAPALPDQPHQGSDEVVTVPRPEGHPPGDTPRHRPGAHAPDQSHSDAAPGLPPACTTLEGEPCGRLLLADPDVVDAVRVSFGAVVADADLVVRRLQMTAAGSYLRWTRTLPPDPLIDPAGRSGAPGTPGVASVQLTRSSTTLLVGTTSAVHAVCIANGDLLWSTTISDPASADQAPAERPWRAWSVDGGILAVAGARAASLDATDGSLRWQRDIGTGPVSATATGLAVLRADELSLLVADDPQPRWTASVPRPAQLSRDASSSVLGPIVVTGATTRLHDPDNGIVLAELGVRAQAVRTTRGIVVAAVWEDARLSELVGLGPDGSEMWRRPGPPVACCGIDLRALEDGRVVALLPRRAGSETGWIIEASTGIVAQRLVRPADVAWVPVAVTDDLAVWLDGTAFVGAGHGGELRWRAESQARLLSARPMLLSTRDGLLEPGGPA